MQLNPKITHFVKNLVVIVPYYHVTLIQFHSRRIEAYNTDVVFGLLEALRWFDAKLFLILQWDEITKTGAK